MATSLFGVTTSINANVTGTLLPQSFVATAGQTLFTLTAFTYTQNTSSLIVFINGQRQVAVRDFLETSSSSFTLLEGAVAGDFIDVLGFPIIADAASAGTLRADLADNTLATKGAGQVGDGALLNYSLATLGRSVHDNGIAASSISGVDPTGVSDSTAALTNFFVSVPSGTKVVFRGTYKIGQLPIVSKNLTLDLFSAVVNLVGNNAGFLVSGTVTQFDVIGGTIAGDGVARIAGTQQICLSFGNESAANVNNVRVFGTYMKNAGVGLRASDGRTGGGTKTRYVHAYGCVAENMQNTSLTDAGTGYGFQFTQADNSGVTDCVAINCQRHGFYFSEGKNYAATNITVVGGGRSTGVRGGFVVSRSHNVTVNGLIVDNSLDCGLVIDVDTQGLAPDNFCANVVVDGYAAYNNAQGDLRVGTSSPATDGVPSNIAVSMRAIVPVASTASSIILYSGTNVKLRVDIDGSAAAGTFRAVTLYEFAGVTYLDRLELTGSIDSSFVGIQIPAALQANTQKVWLIPNRINATSAEYEFISGEDATTNNTLIYKRTNGKNATKTCTAVGAGVTVPVGGLDTLTMSPAAALSVLQFSGATEGASLTLFFTNNNTTLLATNFYLSGAVNFVSTSNDTVTLIYRAGAWRELGRSIN